ncbi:hypothetical protein U3516DRAFT_664275 [Neocallimastix sp. 'constans']
MKFQSILLFAATAAFAYANSLDVSEDEDAVAPGSTDAGVSSEPEGIDNPSNPSNPLVTEIDIDADTPAGNEETPDSGDVASSDNTPDNANAIDTPDNADAIDTPADSTTADDTPLTDTAGEGSDDYGDNEQPAEGGNAEGVDANDVNGEDGEDGDAAEQSAAEEEDSSNAGIAAGIAGAAALSSAGVFLWVKRSKRSEVESNPLTMV